MKRNAKRKGFTLVELLIVIVVIGVLSAMMMLSSTEAVSSAKAAKVINNLRQLKTAALSWYMDNLDIVDGLGRIKKASDKANNFTGQFAYNNEVTTHKLVPYLGNASDFKLINDGDFKGTLEDSSGGHYFTDWRNKGQINHDSNNAENAPKDMVNSLSCTG
ncbi:MAG: type II secretion system protein [Synergistales bacterium]|nr:type II secretion system protein [Synergistales bacterium]MDY6402077.1 type II secretion system protein [Synergistales bacterium]MDY6405262.1 type II secretion system protein [Synergistales bacterium]MDY6410796.1 type II secretion system protein [Synergistales bacterium]MDY6413853.1 type II secretion system protein [Synergistales bacterium]